ncbi:hypothetical protein TELCIR_24363, partial [Teladorsagia circumcincta]
LSPTLRISGSAASSATVSPENGSYAPKELSSSNGVLHKSQSVGSDLTHRGDDPRNGKRKLDDGGMSVSSAPSSGMKRTKTAIGSLASPGTPTVSVLAARKAVQSTKDLVGFRITFFLCLPAQLYSQQCLNKVFVFIQVGICDRFMGGFLERVGFTEWLLFERPYPAVWLFAIWQL